MLQQCGLAGLGTTMLATWARYNNVGFLGIVQPCRLPAWAWCNYVRYLSLVLLCGIAELGTMWDSLVWNNHVGFLSLVQLCGLPEPGITVGFLSLV
jgi:hypothetical protein